MATSARHTRAGNLSPSDDESTSEEDMVVMFDSSIEEDSDSVFTDSDSEAEESSDDTMASAHEWYRIDSDSIPARPPQFELKGSPGVTITVSSPPQQLEIFEAYFDDELIDVIVVETNRYASQLLNSSNLSRHSRFRKWSAPTRELRLSLILWLLQGIVHKPNERMYWLRNRLIETHAYGEIMPRNRFQLVMRMLHFVDKATIENSNCRGIVHLLRGNSIPTLTFWSCRNLYQNTPRMPHVL